MADQALRLFMKLLLTHFEWKDTQETGMWSSETALVFCPLLLYVS